MSNPIPERTERKVIIQVELTDEQIEKISQSAREGVTRIVIQGSGTQPLTVDADCW